MGLSLAKRLALLTLLLMLLSFFSTLLAEAEKASIRVEDYRFVSSTGGPVYPGSQGARLLVALRNTGDADATSLIACLKVPQGFSVVNPCVLVGTLKPGEAGIAEFTVNVDPSVKPAQYVFLLKLAAGNTTLSYATLSVTISEYPRPRLKPVEAWFGEPAEAGAYGLTLTIVLENPGPVDIAGGYGWILLPEGFEPNRVRVELPRIPVGGRAELRVEGLAHTGGEGVYSVRLELNIEAVTDDGIEYWVETIVETAASLGKPHKLLLSLVDVYWSLGGYPGSRGSRLALVVVNRDYCSVSNIYIKPLNASGVRLWPLYSATPLEPRAIGVYELEADVYSRSIRIVLEIYATMHCGSQSLLGYTVLNISVAGEEQATPLRVVDAWLSPSYMVGDRGVTYTPHIIVQNLARDTLVQAIARLKLTNAFFWYGRSEATVLVAGSYGYGSAFEIVFPDIVVAGVDTVKAILELQLTYSQGAASYTVEAEIPITLHLAARKGITVLGYQVEYNGEPAPLLPGQRGATLWLTVYNPLASTVRIYHVEASYEAGEAYAAVPPECESIQPLSSCRLPVTLNTDNVEPGTYSLNVTIHYTVGEGGQEAYTRQTLELLVDNPSNYSPNPIIAAAWWGTPGSLSRPYPGEKAAPLTIVVLNTGHYPARTLVAKPLDVNGSSALCQGLQPGGACTLTLYIDTPEKRVEARLKLQLHYTFTVYGGVYESAETIELGLVLAGVEAEGLVVRWYGWQGGLNVYPGTRDAVLQIQVANMNPYTLLGVDAKLVCPTLGVTAEGYLGGPVQAYGEAVLGLRMDVPSTATPGDHNCTLHLRYWLDTGDVVSEYTMAENIVVKVDSFADAVKLLKTYFAAPAGPGSLAARLYAVIEVSDPASTLLHAELALPKGLRDARTGSTRLVLLPSAAAGGGEGQIGLQQQLPEPLAQALAAAAQASPIQVLVGEVSVSDNAPREFEATLTIVFRDGWGTVHQVPCRTRVVLEGRPEPLKVLVEGSRIPVVNGTARLTVILVNEGSSSLYDVYVVLAPVTPAAYPLNGVKYLGTVRPGESITINYTLVYNPSGYMGTEVNTFSATLAVLYRDAYGNTRVFNTTISAILLVPPEIEIKTAKAVYSNGTLTVDAVLVNTGGTTASRTTLTVYADGKPLTYTIVGDIDPGSETPVRLTVEAKPVKHVRIVVKYFDEFNNEYTASKTLTVSSKPVLAPAGKSGEKTLTIEAEKLIVIGIVAAFLAGAGLAIYTYLRRHQPHQQE